ncbi:hypothetical protein NPX13_g9661 [Xylaria arbuscula]|uniref:Amidase domain-containing protein n=1 Tax=Xylaria arbuscula TaxID=114810 RepID=A0A9W8TIU1_9PEZI|nr:hypothetical protein NPX13_g9661 [Xylaria arbuscula]
MATSKPLDLVRMTATELQVLLEDGKLASVELIKETLAQINRHNTKGLALKALISTAPEHILINRAAALDDERTKGQVRGPFHGLPVLVKDVINTHPNLGMPTTLGSYSLLTAKVSKNATIVDKMIEQGMIIVGKTNLNNQELSSWNPVALGTEVDGSLVQPAARAALYAMKPSVGATELGGVFAVSEEFDSLGSMAKSTLDLARMTELVLNPGARSRPPKDGYLSYFRRDFASLRVGFVDPEQWRWPDNVQPQKNNTREQMKQSYLAIMKLVENNGGEAVFPVTIPPVSEYLINGQPCTILAIRHVFKTNLEKYFSAFSSAEIRTAEGLIQYNKEHASIELPPDFPEQERLVDTIENLINAEQYQHAVTVCRQLSRGNGIDKALSESNIDLVAFPMDSPCPRVAAAAGYPIATMPIGTLDYNGRPFGLAIIAKAGREDVMFSFMSAFEANSEPRAVPPTLVD